ncbi:hypothetical protein P7L78_21480 [Tistrella bauzanensis]|jgi:hypothetical protein|uniref:hypothetical protein n=1 Tax=Tistrella TaxID=171436 RepID=UPI0031F64390
MLSPLFAHAGIAGIKLVEDGVGIMQSAGTLVFKATVYGGIQRRKLPIPNRHQPQRLLKHLASAGKAAARNRHLHIVIEAPSKRMAAGRP